MARRMTTVTDERINRLDRLKENLFLILFRFPPPPIST